jgi:hypothetical protein
MKCYGYSVTDSTENKTLNGTRIEMYKTCYFIRPQDNINFVRRSAAATTTLSEIISVEKICILRELMEIMSKTEM